MVRSSLAVVVIGRTSWELQWRAFFGTCIALPSVDPLTHTTLSPHLDPAGPVPAARQNVATAGRTKAASVLQHRAREQSFFVIVPPSARTPLSPLLAAGGDEDGGETATEEAGPLGVAAAGLGLVACPVVFWSEYTLKTTGCGLPAGPGGALGALEGVSYLVVAGVFLWSIATKVRTGKGLPAGPAGLLGAVEGMSFLAVLAGVLIAGLTYADYGSIPEAVPVDGGRCSDI